MDRIRLTVGDVLSPPPEYDIRAQLIYMDPPSNRGYNPHGHSGRVSDHLYYSALVKAFRECDKRSADSCWMVVFTAPIFRYPIEKIVRESLVNFKLSMEVIWHHGFGLYTRQRFVNDHSIILIFRKGKPKFYWQETAIESGRQKLNDPRADPRGRTLGSVWNIPRVPGNAKIRQHLGKDIKRSMHPWHIVSNIIRSLTKEDDTIYDPYSGSGIVAKFCQAHKRFYYGLDICERYVIQARSFLTAEWDLMEDFDRKVEGL